MSYEGIRAEIPFGLGGLNKSNKATVPIFQLIEADNIEVLDGFAGKEGGSSHQNANAITGTTPVVAGFDYFPSVGTKRGLVGLANGNLRKDDGTFAWATSLATFSTTDKLITISEGGVESFGNAKHVFFCNGADAPLVMDDDGTTAAGLTSPAADWSTTGPHKMLVHNLRNYAIADHTLYYSDTSNHEDFLGGSSGIIQIYPGEGIELINMAAFLGRIYLFKRPYGLYYLDQSADISDPTAWFVRKVSDKIGCAGPRALAQTQNEAVFVSTEGGVHFLSGTERFGDVKDSDITAILNIEDVFRGGAKLSRLNRAQVDYYEDKKQVWICYTSSGGSTNDRILKIDISDIANLKATVTNKDECESIWIYADATTDQRKPLLGGLGGFIWTTDESNRNVNSTAYSARMQTPFTDFGYIDKSLASRDKILDFLEIIAEPTGDNDVNVDVYIDGDLSQTITFNMGTAGSALDSFVLDTDRLDGAGVINKRKRAIGHGVRFSFALRNAGLNQSYNVDKLIAYIRPGGEGART